MIKWKLVGFSLRKINLRLLKFQKIKNLLNNNVWLILIMKLCTDIIWTISIIPFPIICQPVCFIRFMESFYGTKCIKNGFEIWFTYEMVATLDLPGGSVESIHLYYLKLDLFSAKEKRKMFCFIFWIILGSTYIRIFQIFKSRHHEHNLFSNIIFRNICEIFFKIWRWLKVCINQKHKLSFALLNSQIS